MIQPHTQPWPRGTISEIDQDGLRLFWVSLEVNYSRSVDVKRLSEIRCSSARDL